MPECSARWAHGAQGSRHRPAGRDLPGSVSPGLQRPWWVGTATSTEGWGAETQVASLPSGSQEEDDTVTSSCDSISATGVGVLSPLPSGMHIPPSSDQVALKGKQRRAETTEGRRLWTPSSATPVSRLAASPSGSPGAFPG